jgi:hypothetical protein
MLAADKANAGLPLLLGQVSLQLAASGDQAAKAAADDWFRQARLLCPPCVGFPEPVPRPEKPRRKGP